MNGNAVKRRNIKKLRLTYKCERKLIKLRPSKGALVFLWYVLHGVYFLIDLLYSQTSWLPHLRLRMTHSLPEIVLLVKLGVAKYAGFVPCWALLYVWWTNVVILVIPVIRREIVWLKSPLKAAQDCEQTQYWTENTLAAHKYNLHDSISLTYKLVVLLAKLTTSSPYTEQPVMKWTHFKNIGNFRWPATWLQPASAYTMAEQSNWTVGHWQCEPGSYSCSTE